MNPQAETAAYAVEQSSPMAEFIPIYLPQSGPNDVTATLVEWALGASKPT